MNKAFSLTFTRLFLAATFSLLACLSVLADVSKTVTLTEEGTLSNYIDDSEKNTITNLIVSGPINYADVNLMETMAKKGQLSILDMSSATTTNGNLIKEYCFYGSHLVSVSLPSGVQWIKNQAFENCTDLKSVTIPSGALHVQGDVFKGCTSLTSVSLPSSLEYICEGSFQNCTSLKSITIPSGVTKIFYDAFKGCTNLSNVVLQTTSLPECGTDAFANIASDPILTCNSTLLKEYANTDPWSNFHLATTVTLADNERLSAYITADNKSAVTKLKIFGKINSEDIALMKDMATNGALSVLDMSESTAASADLIGSNVFEHCEKLTSISLPENVTSIGNNAFADCYNLTSITIPDGVTSIGYEAFAYCYNLTSITIPDDVTSIGERAFCWCKGLTSITIPNSVTSTGQAAFGWCSGLKSITIPNSLTSIGECEFKGCTSLISITIPNSVTSIGDEAFMSCSSLTKISIPDGVTTIGNDAFRDTGLTSITFGSGVTSIGNEAFQGCGSLAEVTIPDNVTSIGEKAFYESGLKSVTIGKGLTTIGDFVFYRCRSLISVTLGDNVTSIGKSAFNGCWELESIIIPDNVTSIGYAAFNDCRVLTSVTLPKNITTIGSSVFWNCDLTSIDIPNTVTSIGDNAFYNCENLTSVIIPSGLTSIGSGAFQRCSSLTEVTLQGTTLPTSSSNAFSDISSNATLYCKAALEETCKATDPWKSFGTIVSKPFSIAITETGIATACYDDAIDFTDVEGVKAYIASGFNPTTGKVLLTRAMEIPAGTGFVVKGDEGTYEVPCSSTKYMYANLLVGVQAETTLSQTDGNYTNYVLGNDDTDGFGFYLPSDNFVLPANKAYLRIPTSAISSEAKMSKLSISFGDEDEETTGFISVKDLNNGTSGKSDAIYNLNGQRLSNTMKGLNIVNGKKIIIK